MENQIVTINGQRGEYTGKSDLTGLNYVSFYNGSTAALTDEEAIKEGIEIKPQQARVDLSEFKELAYRAHTGTSFDPEKRGKTLIAESEAELTNDLENMPDVERLAYIAGYKKHFAAWLSAKSRCISTMITGGSNFPVRRAEKANQSEHNRVTEFINWRESTLKAIAKRKEASKPQAQKDNEEFNRIRARILDSCATIIGIDNGTVRGSSRALFVSNLTGRINTVAKTGNVDLLVKCLDLIKEVNASGIKKPVISSSHSIWKLADKAEATREAQFDKANKPNREWQTEKCKVVFNYEADRLQLVFDGKPDYNTIQQLKKSAFKWSPTNTAWQRQLTNNAVHAAVNIIGEFRTVNA